MKLGEKKEQELQARMVRKERTDERMNGWKMERRKIKQREWKEGTKGRKDSVKKKKRI